MTQATPLLDWTPPDYNASGITFNKKRDRKPISNQCRKVWSIVQDGRWYTLRQIADLTNAGEASVSARIRDLQNKHGCKYEKVCNEKRVWRYRFDPLAHPKAEAA